MLENWKEKRELKKAYKGLYKSIKLQLETYTTVLNHPEKIYNLRYQLLRLKWQYQDDNNTYNEIEQLENCINMAEKELKRKGVEY